MTNGEDREDWLSHLTDEVLHRAARWADRLEASGQSLPDPEVVADALFGPLADRRGAAVSKAQQKRAMEELIRLSNELGFTE